MVHTKLRRFGALATVLALPLGVVASGAAQAQPAYYSDGTPVAGAYHPLTVSPRYRPMPVRPAYDPYHGPQAVVTAPIAAAATLAALPFHVINAVFPPYGDPARNPLVIVGAPVHAAGQIAQLPFRAAQAPFGGFYAEY